MFIWQDLVAVEVGAQVRVDREEPRDTPHTCRQVGMGVCTLAVSSFVSSLRDRAIGMHLLRLAEEDTIPCASLD